MSTWLKPLDLAELERLLHELCGREPEPSTEPLERGLAAAGEPALTASESS